jgi:hypothetical protein
MPRFTIEQVRQKCSTSLNHATTAQIHHSNEEGQRA